MEQAVVNQQNDPWVHCYLISIYLNSTTTKRRQGDTFKEKKNQQPRSHGSVHWEVMSGLNTHVKTNGAPELRENSREKRKGRYQAFKLDFWPF